MSIWSDIGKAILGGLGHGGPPMNPNGFTPPPQPPTMGSNAGVPKPPGYSSGLASYAAPPIAPPPFMPSSQMGMSPFNMAGNLSGPVGSTVQPDQPKDGQDTPWYKNPAILNTIAGAGSAILQSRSDAANRAQQQQRIDLEKQQYEDQHRRQQATSDALNPIIARLIGQQMQQRNQGHG